MSSLTAPQSAQGAGVGESAVRQRAVATAAETIPVTALLGLALRRLLRSVAEGRQTYV